MEKTGIELISEERQRQINVEGWTHEHDSEHYRGEMAMAAAAYAYPKETVVLLSDAWTDTKLQITRKRLFPVQFWDIKWWKPTPKNRIKELTKAGALIAAEIDRIQHTES